MTIKASASYSLAGAFDAEAVNLASVDYEPGVTLRGLSFEIAGDIKVTTEAGNDVTIPSGSLAAGMIHSVRYTKIFKVGTTATGIVAYT